MKKLFGLQVNGEWFISHMESEKEVWEDIGHERGGLWLSMDEL